jgi:hypothetical protein
MKHNLEPLLIIALVVISFVLKETAELDVKYVVAGGGLLVIGYITHLVVQHYQGVIVRRKFPWLYSIGDYGAKEGLHDTEMRAAPNSTVYVLSHDLHNDARVATTQLVVRHNLSKNVRYKYISRDDTDESTLNIAKLMETFSDYPELISVYIAK